MAMKDQAVSSPVASATRSENDRPQSDRTRAPVSGGPRLKLSVHGNIPGYHLFWENDQDAAIEQLLGEGFDFATAEEVNMVSRTSMKIVADADVDSRVSKYVGVKADGTPLRAYLLKCPDDIWEERSKSIMAQADHWDSAIRAGAISNVDNRYKPAGFDIRLRN